MNFDPKTHDPDRYLLSLFISSAEGRAACTDLDYFNFEVAQLRDTVSTSPIGYIRLQWWRDQLAALCHNQEYAPHPALAALSGLPPAALRFNAFDAVLDARAMEFDEMAFSAPDDVLSYLDGCQGQLLIIKNSVLGSHESEGRLIALARYYGIAGLIRSLPYYAKAGRKILPNLFPDDVAPHREGMIAAVKALCTEGRALRPDDRFTHRYWRATRALADAYYNAIEKAGYDPFHLQPVPFKELRIWLKSF